MGTWFLDRVLGGGACGMGVGGADGQDGTLAVPLERQSRSFYACVGPEVRPSAHRVRGMPVFGMLRLG